MPIWTVQAKNDLQSQLEYIAKNNLEAGKHMAIRIKESCIRLDQFPNIGRSGVVKNTRELIIPKTPYVCVYRIVDYRVEILRLLHTKMMWPE